MSIYLFKIIYIKWNREGIMGKIILSISLKKAAPSVL